MTSILVWYDGIFMDLGFLNLIGGCIAGPTHVLVVRGLDEHIDEEMLHYEFSKHAPIKVLDG